MAAGDTYVVWETIHVRRSNGDRTVHWGYACEVWQEPHLEPEKLRLACEYNYEEFLIEDFDKTRDVVSCMHCLLVAYRGHYHASDDA